MTWTEHAWQAIAPIYKRIIEMPFLAELSNGTLAQERFQFYIMQDSGYLEHFGKALALLGARAAATEDALAFMRFAENALVVESLLHESYLKDFGISDKGALEPACHHYVHFLKSTAALDAVEIGMAAVLPCFWIYKAVGDHISQSPQAPANPYQKWIDTYGGEEFGIAVRQAIAICDRAASATTEQTRAAMTKAFITASRLEYDFWDGAYQLRMWK